MLLFDKFGEKGLNKYYKVLYKLIYSERIISSQVRRDTVAELPVKYISVINHAKNLADLVELDNMWNNRKCEATNSGTTVQGIEIIKDLLFGNN
jgi:hypothetical protein